MTELNEKNLQEQYPYLINAVLSYIEEIKLKNKSASLIEIIMDFSLKNSISLEMIGDAIASDVYFKSFIERDCKLHGILDSEVKEFEDW
jgi:hypothetical protein